MYICAFVQQLGTVEVEMGTEGAVNLHIEKPWSPFHIPRFVCLWVFRAYPTLLFVFASPFEPDLPLNGFRIQRDRHGSFQPPGVLDMGDYVRFGAWIILLR